VWGLRLLRFIPVLVPLLCPFRVRSFQNLASSHGIDWMPIQWALRGVEEVYIRSSIVGNKIYNLCTARKKTVSLHLFDTEMGCLPALHLGSDSMSRPSSFSRTFWGDLGVLESVCMCEGDVVRCRQRKARWQRSLLREFFGYVCESSKQHALLSWYRLPPLLYLKGRSMYLAPYTKQDYVGPPSICLVIVVDLHSRGRLWGLSPTTYGSYK
jgi:hypothetical protein